MAHVTKQVNSQKIKDMNIALVGYGKMGHEIEEIAVQRGHKISLIVDIENSSDLNKEKLAPADVAIEFSSPGSAFANIIKCLELKIPVVSGTTGWLKDYDKAVEICRENGTSFIHSSNFSIGVNLLFMLNRELAHNMTGFPEYNVSIEEIHHTGKLDAPSGTAIALADGIRGHHPGYRGWCFDTEKLKDFIPVRSVREGSVPGIHKVTWASGIDILEIRHEALNRKGFALGAVVAAEYIRQHKGVFTMNNVLGF